MRIDESRLEALNQKYEEKTRHWNRYYRSYYSGKFDAAEESIAKELNIGVRELHQELLDYRKELRRRAKEEKK